MRVVVRFLEPRQQVVRVKHGVVGHIAQPVPAVHQDALFRSCRNVPGSGYRVVSDLNAYEVLKQGTLILEEAALKELEERYSDA